MLKYLNLKIIRKMFFICMIMIFAKIVLFFQLYLFKENILWNYVIHSLIEKEGSMT